jgi:hypothetical protein
LLSSFLVVLGTAGIAKADSCPASTTGQATLNVTGSTAGTSWGGNSVTWDGVSYPTYTSDSSLGKSAVHAGVVANGVTAQLRICLLPGLSSYTGSTRNGVTTFNSGIFSSSMIIIPA